MRFIFASLLLCLTVSVLSAADKGIFFTEEIKTSCKSLDNKFTYEARCQRIERSMTRNGLEVLKYQEPAEAEVVLINDDAKKIEEMNFALDKPKATIDTVLADGTTKSQFKTTLFIGTMNKTKVFMANLNKSAGKKPSSAPVPNKKVTSEKVSSVDGIKVECTVLTKVISKGR